MGGTREVPCERMDAGRGVGKGGGTFFRMEVMLRGEDRLFHQKSRNQLYLIREAQHTIPL